MLNNNCAYFVFLGNGVWGAGGKSWTSRKARKFAFFLSLWRKKSAQFWEFSRLRVGGRRSFIKFLEETKKEQLDFSMDPLLVTKFTTLHQIVYYIVVFGGVGGGGGKFTLRRSWQWKKTFLKFLSFLLDFFLLRNPDTGSGPRGPRGPAGAPRFHRV